MNSVPASTGTTARPPQAFYAFGFDVVRVEPSQQASAGFSHIALR
jgi:hypothetical protein